MGSDRPPISRDTSQETSTSRPTQLRSRWLPVNSRLAKFMQDRYPFCPRCLRKAIPEEQIETVDHLLCCPSGDPNVLTWLESDFQKLLQKMETPLMMAKAFSLGLKHWANGTEGAPQWDPGEYISRPVQQAMEAQTRIGWEHVFQGFIARDWQEIYEKEKANKVREGIFPNKYHKNWTSATYSAMLAFFMRTWRDRNEALHGRDQVDKEQIMRTRLSRRVDRIYSMKDQVLIFFFGANLLGMSRYGSLILPIHWRIRS
jgi:hypothetical protein